LEGLGDVTKVFQISYSTKRNCFTHGKYIDFLNEKEEERRKIEEQNKREILKRQEEHVFQMKL
jgi:hypothetical protein